jgi:hypothetical protein
MSQSVLDSVTLAYELIWNQWRKRSGVRLIVDSDSTSAVDGSHLLATISEHWPDESTRLLLSVRSPLLLTNILDQTAPQKFWIEIPDALLHDPLFAGRVRRSRDRGVHMVWRGDPGMHPPGEALAWFHNTLRSLTPQEALAALRSSLRQLQDESNAIAVATPSPVLAGGLYEGLASQALVEHGLDRQHVWGVVGWPGEEILYGYRFRQIQASRQLLTEIVGAIDADESLENLEHRMGDDPLLNYRFLRWLNSAAMGLRNEIGSIREGLMTVGMSRLRGWLMEQLPHASGDPNLEPLRKQMVLRARIMERLADAGEEDALRREVFLCGIFSQVDLLLGEALGAAIHRLPLAGRIASAILGQTGPYSAWLQVASALESNSTRAIRDLCRAHKIPAEDVNRALLRALAEP